MLLVEKVANRVVRQNNDDIQSSLALALSVLQQSPLDLQIKVSSRVDFPLQYLHSKSLQALTEILHECQRLTTRVVLPKTTELTFLDVSL